MTLGWTTARRFSSSISRMRLKRSIERQHAAAERDGAAGVAGAGAADDQRHAMLVAEPRDRGDLLRRAGKQHDVGDGRSGARHARKCRAHRHPRACASPTTRSASRTCGVEATLGILARRDVSGTAAPVGASGRRERQRIALTTNTKKANGITRDRSHRGPSGRAFPRCAAVTPRSGPLRVLRVIAPSCRARSSRGVDPEIRETAFSTRRRHAFFARRCTNSWIRVTPSRRRSSEVAYEMRKKPGASKPSPAVTATCASLQQRLGELARRPHALPARARRRRTGTDRTRRAA